jgi:hypothetical protein
MLAYAIYKKARREWVLNDNPDQNKVENYRRFITDTTLELYRNEARSRLTAYAATVVEASRPEYVREATEAAIITKVAQQQDFNRNLCANIQGAPQN